MSIFKAEAQGDTLYIEAESEDGAKDKLNSSMGEIPSHLVTWTEVDELPDGEELL